MDKVAKRGGFRPGSGRKPAAQETKRVNISISVSPDTKKKIEELRSRNIKVGQVLDDLIRQYFDSME